LERTFTIIKPDAVEAGYSGAIITAIESAGFRLMAMKKRIMRRQEAEVFYAVHRDKAFFSDLMAYITRSPVIVMALEKENAVADFRTLIGATDPAKADPGTIRQRFATSISENAIHGSDSPENGRLEVAFFFAEHELIS
jgi:nucleoside-diphosphate kinase